MTQFFKKLKVKKLENSSAKSRNFSIQNLDYNTVNVFFKQIIQNSQIESFINRFNIVCMMDKYSDLLEYIKSKSEVFFENIRTEVDESYVDDFVKVVSIQRHLGKAFRTGLLLEFIKEI